MFDRKQIKVFFMANVPVSNVPASFGGATVLAQEMLDFVIADHRFQVKAAPIRNNWRSKWHIFDHILWIFRFPFYTLKSDVVSIHATWDFTFTTAPIVWLWAKLMQKRIVYHFFGGNFHTQYNTLPGFLKWIYKKTLLRSDVVFFETKELIQYFEKEGVHNAQWLPNARKATAFTRVGRPFGKRFVFISRVIPEKGIEEIVEAASKLPDDYIIDVYGPIDSRYLDTSYFENSHVAYRGVLKPDEVHLTLSQYDVLLLPTWFKYEGYPGIVLEALSLGIPTIATRWNAIPEIIEDGKNGVLIPIKNPAKLQEAILIFNKENYKIFQKNALNSFTAFDSDKVFLKLVNSYL